MKQKTKKKLDKWFLLNWRKLWIVVVSGFLAVMIHNFGSAGLTYLLGYEFEEPVFFIYVVIVLPLYVLISGTYSLIRLIKDRKLKLTKELVIAIVVGLFGAWWISLYWEGPWFFGLFFLLITCVVYYLIRKFSK